MTNPAKHIRIDRHRLREPDEFQSVATRALGWADTHRNALLAVGGALLAVIAIVALVQWRQARADEAAALRFRDLHAAFTAGRYPEAASGFAQLTADAGRSAFGRLAVLYRAHALARSGDAAGAATVYGEYLANRPPTDYLRQEALLGLGAAQETAGDQAAALDAYTQASELDGPFKTDASLGAARVNEAQGRADAARAIYERLLAGADADPALRSFLLSKVPAPAAPAAAGS